MRFLTGALLAASFMTTPAFAEPGDLPADSAWQMVQRGEIVVLDVRTPSEWAMTGLPRDSHGINVKDRDFVAQARGAVLGDLDHPIAVICRTGQRSSEAASMLEKAGFTHVFDIKEGMLGKEGAGDGWLKRGLPTDPFIPPYN
ncbi:rhodanese-like domain-containing protein [Hyphomonas jannaschiana]|jgi:rhodanese-related sulfurtransferase|uniref:Rhodanese-related sulfurtransferase n=1 Tax=Hyphomonas jannaschiana VP2 TaxID=1280952 RepID=A0A059F870_9PROT|nr:rhodanese-like domain-containing protein [Hyphomonas jannaschiana]KCZ86787.1 rhodanese-related sulfurtransferase [Hyphomonas jannaschiana VP2]MCA8892602.1 rhodanese-like domain-containing protein [Hyphomonas sp.]